MNVWISKQKCLECPSLLFCAERCIDPSTDEHIFHSEFTPSESKKRRPTCRSTLNTSTTARPIGDLDTENVVMEESMRYVNWLDIVLIWWNESLTRSFGELHWVQCLQIPQVSTIAVAIFMFVQPLLMYRSIGFYVVERTIKFTHQAGFLNTIHWFTDAYHSYQSEKNGCKTSCWFRETYVVISVWVCDREGSKYVRTICKNNM